MYESTSASADWEGARLAWTGVDWALGFADGRLARFRACGFGIQGRCTLTSYRGADGHVIRYRHNRAGRLERIEAGRDRWIALDYDDQDRVVRAYASTNRDVRYGSDGGGRLVEVMSDGAVTHKFHVLPISTRWRGSSSPDTDIENSYKGGRCVKQVNRLPRTDHRRIPLPGTTRSTVRGSRRLAASHSDGTWERYSFDKSGFTTSETWGAGDRELVGFTLQRDPETNGVVSLSLTCADQLGSTAAPLQPRAARRRGLDEVRSGSNVLLVDQEGTPHGRISSTLRWTRRRSAEHGARPRRTHRNDSLTAQGQAAANSFRDRVMSAFRASR